MYVYQVVDPVVDIGVTIVRCDDRAAGVGSKALADIAVAHNSSAYGVVVLVMSQCWVGRITFVDQDRTSPSEACISKHKRGDGAGSQAESFD